MKDLDVIEGQLTRVLSFFPRVDVKATGLFTVNSAILTISALNVEAGDLARWQIAVPGAFVIVALVASYAFLYQCNFPDIKGGQGSLVYFTAISERTESNYKTELEAAGEEEYRADLIGQIWRNSQILSEKYKAVAMATRLTLAALVPFAVFLIMTAVEHTRVPVVNG
jgi:hypothetical protein